MYSHFTSSNLTRRQFLKTLLLAGGAIALPGLISEAKPIPSVTAQDPFWWMNLQDNILHGPQAANAAFGMPGSLMKLVAAAALLEERLITPNDVLECRGAVTINGQKYRCQHTHGKFKMQEALAASCNVYFAQASEVLSTHRFLQYAEAFQLHQPTRRGEGSLFPDHSALNHNSQLYVLGLSRTLQPNTCQLIRMTRHIAKGDIHGFHTQTWQLLRNGMRLAATHGTAKQIDPYNQLRVAAKTGTAPHGQTFQSWVVGFFPFERPKYVFCTRSTIGTAKDVAVPLTHRYLFARQWH